MGFTGFAVATALLLPGALLTPAPTDQIELPTSDAAQLAATEILKQLPNFRPDRLLPSDVPGPVVNDELVEVGLTGDGGVGRVVLEQRLRLEGIGDYAIRERGPAREATSLSTDPAPVTRRGAVVWQGFSPGSRALAARLLLDPQIESPHLPLAVGVTFTGADGVSRPLDPGGRVPAAGTVTVTVRNVTEQPAVLPTGTDAPAAELAGPLDKALAVARTPSAAWLPNTDHGLPKALTVTAAAREQGAQAVPFLLVGSLRVQGTSAKVGGPATTTLPDGARFQGVLGGLDGAPQVSFTVTTRGAGTLLLDLGATATLDKRLLAPPRGLASWKAWASAGPTAAERKAALDLLVEVAATGARAASYSPYLGADLRGTGSTRFHYAFAPADKAAAVRRELTPRWGPITLALLGICLLGVSGGALWRRL